jgi:Bifunctional DNA primase/polymerase, N-terminal
MSTTTTATDFRLTTRSNGYPVIPLRGKNPGLAKKWKWQHTDVSPEQIEGWARDFGDATNTGILTKDCPTIDVDILHAEAAEACKALICEQFAGLAMSWSALARHRNSRSRFGLTIHSRRMPGA